MYYFEELTIEQLYKYANIDEREYKLPPAEHALTTYCRAILNSFEGGRGDYLAELTYGPFDETAEKAYEVGKAKVAQKLVNVISSQYIDKNKKSINYSVADLEKIRRTTEGWHAFGTDRMDIMPEIIYFNALRVGLVPERNDFKNTREKSFVETNVKETTPISTKTIMDSIDAKTSAKVK